MERPHSVEDGKRTHQIRDIMKLKFEINDISMYRSELMGWAIVWIMMLHFTFTQIKPLGFIAQYGFAGVEVFMMVSGLGLFFSLEKDNNLQYFYKKRLLRIFPTYYFLGIFASILLYQDNFWQYLFRYSTIGFWTGSIYGEWYIPSIIALYIAAPFIKKLFDKKQFLIICFICFAILLASFFIVSKNILPKGEAHFFLLYRIPAFILGMACAYWILHVISSKYFIWILLLGIPTFVALYPHHHQVYNYKYFSLLFLLPIFLLTFVSISKSCTWINPIISKIGKASLEIYIIQGMFFHAILTGMIVINPEWHDVVAILLIIISSLLGILTHWLIDKSSITRLL